MEEKNEVKKEPGKMSRLLGWYKRRNWFVKILLAFIAIYVIRFLLIGRATYDVALLAIGLYGPIMLVVIGFIWLLILVFRKKKVKGRIVIAVVLGLVIAFCIVVRLAPWEMYNYISRYVRHENLNMQYISSLPETDYEAIQPKVGIKNLAEQRVQENEIVYEPFMVRVGEEYRWTIGRGPSPKYFYQKYSGNINTVFSLPTQVSSVNFLDKNKQQVNFDVGETLMWSRNTETAVVRSLNFFQLFRYEVGDTRFLRDDSGQWVQVTSLIHWKGIFFPQPEFGGVHVIRQNSEKSFAHSMKRKWLGYGEIYTTEEMKQFKYLQNQNLVSKKFGDAIANSFHFQNGFLGPLPGYHKGDIRIPVVEGGFSEQPILGYFKMSQVAKGAKDMLYYVYALEPYDESKHGLAVSVFIPADGTGKTYVHRYVDDALPGPTAVPSKIRESKKQYDWSVTKIADIRCYNKKIDGTLHTFWMVSIVSKDSDSERYVSGGVPQLMLVDPKYDRVIDIDPDHPEMWVDQIRQELGAVWGQ